MAQVGHRLRAVGRGRDLGLRELAARSGVSHSTISLIERDRMSPTVDTLGAILDALGTTLSGFFAELKPGAPYTPFYGPADLTEIGNPDIISYRIVGMNHPDRQLLMLQETYAIGADTGEEISHPAQEAGLITRGAVEVSVAGQTRVLRPGDAYYFDSRLPHRFRNVAEEPSQIISAVAPPTY